MRKPRETDKEFCLRMNMESQGHGNAKIEDKEQLWRDIRSLLSKRAKYSPSHAGRIARSLVDPKEYAWCVAEVLGIKEPQQELNSIKGDVTDINEALMIALNTKGGLEYLSKEMPERSFNTLLTKMVTTKQTIEVDDRRKEDEEALNSLNEFIIHAAQREDEKSSLQGEDNGSSPSGRSDAERDLDGSEEVA